VSKRKPENKPVKVVEVPEPVEAAADIDDMRTDEIRARAERQLRRGRLSRLNDRIAGGPARPGEQQISRSPFVLGMGFVILGLGIVAAVFFLLIRSGSEARQLSDAMQALDESSYNEAEFLFTRFLTSYPRGVSSETALIGRHSARIRRYTEGKTFTVDSVVEARQRLDEFFRECRDFDQFRNEREKLIGYARKITRAAALVAIDSASQQALDASLGAMELLDRLTKDGDDVTAETREGLETLQRQASAEILKSNRLSKALETIRRTLGEGNTLGALAEYQELIERFDVLKTDPDFQKVLSDICAKEVDLVVAEDIGTEAFLSDPAVDQRPSLSLNLRTTARSDLVSQGRRVFGCGGDVVCALDSETGDLIWKRDIGGSAPFEPIQVEVSSPALLLFHSERNELMLVQQADNSLIWRQSIGSAASGPPLILNQQIYITTVAGDLWQVSLATGRAVRRVRFNQPVQGPPTVSRDQTSLIIPGRSAFVYTLSLQPLECRNASWIGYGEGSVAAPVVTMGDLFLLCENYSAENSRLRALEMSGDGSLVEREQRTVVGQVLDPCLLRGDQLYIPSTPQRVTAFRVSDRPDNDALSQIGTNQLENSEFTSMFLVAGPGGNLWMGSTALRRFRVTSQAVLLDEAAVAKGQHLYPMQVDDDSLLVTTTDPYSASVFFTRVNRNSMTGVWRTVLSTNLVAAGQSTSGRSLIAVSDFGSVFRIPVDQLDESGFHTTAVGSPIRLPDGLRDPVGGTELPDGRLAAWCRGKNRSLWTFSPAGQLEQNWDRDLPGVLEANPVPLAGGLVVASPGRLTLTATRQKADDYQVSRDLNAESSWKSLTAISDTQLMAINSDNKMVQVEYRKNPRPHLAEVSVTTFDGETAIAPVAGGDYLCIATTDGRLLLRRSSTLERVQERELGGVVSYPLHIAADRLFVEIDDDQVEVFELDDELNSAGTFPKNGSRLVDAPLPLPNGGFLAAFSDGTVMKLDATGLPIGEPTLLGQKIQRGPIAVGGSVIVLAADGSLYSLNDLANN
jgi:outer membrane protein assembly factor BamB